MKRLITATTWGLAAFVAVAFPSVPRRLAATVAAMDPWEGLLTPGDPLWTEEVHALAAEAWDDGPDLDFAEWDAEVTA